MQNELKPCPFCGATPYIICNKYRHNEFSWSVKCSNTNCPTIPMTYEHTEERDAINNWNQRMEDVAEVKHGEWYLLKNCANEGVYCSVCTKKVYKTDYANQKIKSPFCPNCGAKMDKKAGVEE